MRTKALVLAVAALAGGLLTQPASAGNPGWIVTCAYARSAADDPVVFPGQPGASHSHDFLGNRTTGATSTYADLRAGTTSCATAADHASYWAPSMYQGTGRQVIPGDSTRQRSYYRADNLAAGTKVEPFPADLRLIAGNSKARSAAENPELGKEIYWGCSDNSTGKLAAPPSSCSTGIISLHVGFPNCWDGVLTHQNDTVHVVYPSRGVCPSAFPRTLPRLIERFEYPVGTTTGSVYLASGGTWTAHADFWNAWDQSVLSRLVANCLNAGVDCGKNPA